MAPALVVLASILAHTSPVAAVNVKEGDCGNGTYWIGARSGRGSQEGSCKTCTIAHCGPGKRLIGTCDGTTSEDSKCEFCDQCEAMACGVVTDAAACGNLLVAGVSAPACTWLARRCVSNQYNTNPKACLGGPELPVCANCKERCGPGQYVEGCGGISRGRCKACADEKCKVWVD